VRVAAAIFVTLLINSSSNIHPYARHGLVVDQRQKSREESFKLSVKKITTA
jgi:hypothetical protein